MRASILSLAVLLAGAPAHAATFVVDYTGYGNNTLIDENEGSTHDALLRHDAVEAFGSGTIEDRLIVRSFVFPPYEDVLTLQRLMHIGQISFTALNDSVLTFRSFNAATLNDPDDDRGPRVVEKAVFRVYNDDYSSILWDAAIAPAQGDLGLLEPQISTTGTIHFQWGADPSTPISSSQFLGVDNITYSTAVVPLPAGLPLLLGALGLFGLMSLRRNR